jgi:hypothetical protein
MLQFYRFLVLFLSILTFSCASNVLVDYDREADFKKYRTYKYVKKDIMVIHKDTKSPYINDLNQKRFSQAIDRELRAKGYERITEGTPDFKVLFHVRLQKKLNMSHYSYSYWPDRGYGQSITAGRIFEEGSLIIDIIDVEDNQLIWRGVAEGELFETEDIDSVINKVVKNIMKEFPPQN